MSNIISEIYRIDEAYGYVPVITETSGLLTTGVGIVSLGVSGILKIQEFYTGQKTTIPYISNDAAHFHTELGKEVLKHGLKKIAPTAGVVLTIYILVSKYLTQ